MDLMEGPYISSDLITEYYNKILTLVRRHGIRLDHVSSVFTRDSAYDHAWEMWHLDSWYRKLLAVKEVQFRLAHTEMLVAREGEELNPEAMRLSTTGLF